MVGNGSSEERGETSHEDEAHDANDSHELRHSLSPFVKIFL